MKFERTETPPDAPGPKHTNSLKGPLLGGANFRGGGILEDFSNSGMFGTGPILGADPLFDKWVV